jgi:hypothetical protein
VGMFKDFKGMMEGSAQLAQQGHAIQQQYSNAQVQATQPVDLNDPLWAPIEGITLDQYAKLTAALVRQNLGGIEQIEAWLETQGVKKGTWKTVQEGWTQRMAGNVAVSTRYGTIYAQS